MTKTVTIPMSKETCAKIRYGIGLTVGFGLPILLILTMFSVWFDWADWGDSVHTGAFLGRAILFMVSLVVTIISLVLTLQEMYDRKHWIDFKCNCDKEKENATD